jgi:hypothetical protein
MSGVVEWLAAQGEEARPGVGVGEGDVSSASKDAGGRDEAPPLEYGDVAGWPTEPGAEDANAEGCGVYCDPGLRFYRRRTISLLRRYMRFSLETGRLPSIVGREFFRATVTSYRSVTFEDRVIFVRDVEKVLERLDYWDQQLVARVMLQEHNYDKAAYLLHCSRKTIQRRVPEVLDMLSGYFLEVGLLVDLAAEQ